MYFDGTRGKEFLEAIIYKAKSKQCSFECDENFNQDSLGAVHCLSCNNCLVSQNEVDYLELKGMLPKSTIPLEFLLRNKNIFRI